jgi:iron(III) transport system substrate-binding protein
MNSFKILLIMFVTLTLLSCSKTKDTPKIVIYTSVDQVYSSQIFKDFEQKTGIKVLAVYDTEASKAVGLEKRLLMEKSHPRADIFWNSEPIRTARLAKQNLFKPYKQFSTKNYQSNIYYDAKRRWFGVGKRDRVLIVNTKQVKKESYPKLLQTLWSKEYQGKVAISSPYIGTAATHFAALYHRIGEKKFTQLLKTIKSSHVTYLAGNSVVKDVVGEGKYPIGLVDSDDALAGIKAGLPIAMIHYDQNTTGTFSIIGTVAQLKDSPHPNEAKRFMDYLLTPETEQKLIGLGAVQYSVYKQTKSKAPKQWTQDPNLLLDDLQHSYRLMKEIL